MTASTGWRFAARPEALRPWQLLPSNAINGLSVALGIGLIQLIAVQLAGAYTAALVVSGAISTSIADMPDVVTRTWHRVGSAAALVAVAALIIDLLRPWPIATGGAVVMIAFCSLMTQAWGARAGGVSFAPIVSMIFSLAVPPSDNGWSIAAWTACGSFAYLAWSLAASAVLQRRYRSLVLVATLRTAAQHFLLCSERLADQRRDTNVKRPPRTRTSVEAMLAARFQAARDLLFPVSESARWQMHVAILLHVIELRDTLFANRLDADRLGSDIAGRALAQSAARALRLISKSLDAAADTMRNGKRLTAGPASPRALGSEPDQVVTPEVDTDRAWLVAVQLERLERMLGEADRIDALLAGREQPLLPLTHAQLQRFVEQEGWPLRALRPHCRRESPVFRHAIRMSLALGTAYFLSLALPWHSHPVWLVLSVAVVLRGSLGETLVRRNARVVGTALGCLVVVGLARLPSGAIQYGIFLTALGTAHAFVMDRYWLTASAASITALMQSHLINPAAGFAVAERLADTVLGAVLAWLFSYVMPFWERRGVPDAIRRVAVELRASAAQSLRIESGTSYDELMARRNAYDALDGLHAALQRTVFEPSSVQLAAVDITEVLDRGERFMAHLTLVRHALARADGTVERPTIELLLTSSAASVDARLDLQSIDAFPRVAASTPSPDADLEFLPAQLPHQDVERWLSNRLSQLVDEALGLGIAARTGLDL